jgi:hypothetical protein
MRAAWLLVGNLLPVFTAYSLSIPSYGSASGVVADVGASECNPIVTLDKGHRHFESYKGRNEADGGHREFSIWHSPFDHLPTFS